MTYDKRKMANDEAKLELLTKEPHFWHALQAVLRPHWIAAMMKTFKQLRVGPVAYRRVTGETWRMGAPMWFPGDDHVTAWEHRQSGNVFWLSQPYDLDESVVREMLKFADGHGLRFTISAYGSWHFPGHTMRVTWTKKTTPFREDYATLDALADNQ